MDSVIRARIDSATKKEAEAVLDEIGLSASAAIRLFLKRIARQGRLPFRLRTGDFEESQNLEDDEFELKLLRQAHMVASYQQAKEAAEQESIDLAEENLKLKQEIKNLEHMLIHKDKELQKLKKSCR